MVVMVVIVVIVVTAVAFLAAPRACSRSAFYRAAEVSSLWLAVLAPTCSLGSIARF